MSHAEPTLRLEPVAGGGGTPTGPERPHAAGQPRPLGAAKAPVGSGRVSTIGVVLALLVTGLGVVGVQTALVSAGLLHGNSWLESGVQTVDGLTPSPWLLPLGVALVLLGLWLLLGAVLPRRRTAVALQADTGVFLRSRDLARLAVAAADEVDGVSDAHASASRSAVTVRVTTTGGGSVGGAVEHAVTERLQPLQRAVRVRVSTKEGNE